MAKREYFLTHSDVSHLAPYFGLLGVSCDDLRTKSAGFLQLIKDKIEQMFDDVDVKIINLAELQPRLVEKMESELDLSEYYVVSLEEDWLGEDGYKLQICRPDNKIEGADPYCARPGYPDPMVQLQEAARLSGDKKIIITDDGLFSGGTVEWVIQQLRSLGKTEFVIYVPVATKKGFRKFRKMGVKVCQLISLDEPIDWVCERDLRYFIARTGKPIRADDGQLLSISHNGQPFYFSRPYPRPTGALGDSASIPAGHVDDLSRFILEWHIDLFSKLEDIAGPVKVADLAKLSTLHSIPYTGSEPNMDQSIREFLVDLLKLV